MKTTHEVVATRETFDGQMVQIWTDGAVTVGHPYNNRIVARGLAKALWFVVADEVCVYDAGEVKGLIAAARKAYSKIIPAGWIGAPASPVAEVRRLMRAYMAAA